VVPLDFPNTGSYSTSFDLFSEKTTGKCKSSNSALIPAAKTANQSPSWRDPIAHVLPSPFFFLFVASRYGAYFFSFSSNRALIEAFFVCLLDKVSS